MPIEQTPGNCGPRCFCKAVGWDWAKYGNDAKSLMGHVDGKGVDPDGLVKAFRKQGYKSRWSEQNTVPGLVAFLEEHKSGIVIVNYTDFNFEMIAGHYVLFYGLDKNGNLRTWNPDVSEKEEFILPRKNFETVWHDYTVDTFDLLENVAVFAHRDSR